jgi:hypothetical protein
MDNINNLFDIYKVSKPESIDNKKRDVKEIKEIKVIKPKRVTEIIQSSIEPVKNPEPEATVFTSYVEPSVNSNNARMFNSYSSPLSTNLNSTITDNPNYSIPQTSFNNKSLYFGSGGGGNVSEWYQYPALNGSVTFTTGADVTALTGSNNNLLYDGVSILPLNWYQYPTENGQIDFVTNTGVATLKAQDGNLFFNDELLAKAGDIQDITAWADYPAINNVDMANYNISGGTDITISGTLSSEIVEATNVGCEKVITSLGEIIETNTISLNVVDGLTTPTVLTSITGGDISTTGYVSSENLKIVAPTGTCELTTNAGGTTLFINGEAVQTGGSGDVSQWATFPAVSAVDMVGNNLSNVGAFSMPASVTNKFSVGGGSILTPVLANEQFALTTKIVNVSPLTPMEITSAGGINMTANATTGTQEFNISFIGTSGNDMNITAPDINLTCTDATSFMNLTAPAGVTIAGGGLFVLSGVLEAIGAGDISLLSGGNVRIGSGNLLGATTQVEKFEYTDNVVEPMGGVFDLKLKNIEVINVPRDAGSAGYFSGVFNVQSSISNTFTVNSVASSSQKTIWSVQADQGGSVYKAMNLTADGGSTINFNMTAGGNTMNMNYNGADLLTISKPLTVTGALTGTSGNFGALFSSDTQIHLGQNSALVNQGAGGIAIGRQTATSNQGIDSIAIGYNSGNDTATRTISIGYDAGYSQSANAISIGTNAGQSTGTNSISIGNLANTNPPTSSNNTIMLNATGVRMTSVADNSAYIAPVRNVSTQPAGTAFAMGYTSATGEITVANTKVNDIENTVNNTQQISYDTGLLTTTINGITKLQTVLTSGEVSIGDPVTPANLIVSGLIALPYTNVVTQPSFTYYVSKNGRVGASGSITDPLSTINEALSKPASLGAVDPCGMTIYLAVGSYSDDININIAPATLPSVSIIGMGDDTDDSKRVQIRGAITINGTDATLVNTVNTVIFNNLSVFAKNASSSAITMTGRGYRVYLKNGLYTTPFTSTTSLISLSSSVTISNSIAQLVIDNCSMSMLGTGHIINIASGQLFEIQNTDMTHRGTGLAVNMSGGAFSVANQSAFTTTGAVLNIVQTSAGLTNITSCIVSGRASPTVALITLGTNANMNLSESTVQNLNTTEANNTSRYVYTTSATGNFIAGIRNNITNSASPATVQQITPWQSAVPPASQLLYFGNIYSNQTATLIGNLPAQGGANWNAVRQFNTDTYTSQLQVIATSATPITLSPTARGKTFILTGTTTQAFTTTQLGLADVGFHVTVHNGNGSGGGDINMTGMTGTTIIHNRTALQNGGDVYLYWTGTGLVGY